MFGVGRSCFDSDLFKQSGESWIGTQTVQTAADAVLAEIHDRGVFVFQASPKTSEGFVVIA
jgi:hypothetical protein